LPQYGVVTSATDFTKSLFEFQDQLIAHTSGDQLIRDSAGDGSVWTTYSGTYSVPDSTEAGSRVRSFQSNKNFYFLTDAGVYKLAQITDTPRFSGVPAALGGSGATTGAGGFMSNNTNVAYRVLWGYKDSNDNLILGAVGDRIVVSNTSGGTRNVSVTFLIPPTIDTTYFYQVYRSAMSPDLATQPNDELQLVYENNPTGGEIAAGQVTFTDTTPDNLRQATIYTAPSQEGIANNNYQPPFAKDATVYRGYSFYANTRSKHRFFINLLSANAPSGIQANDTITITDNAGPTVFTITGKLVENAAAGEFQVFSTGDPAADIDQTARSIVKVINVYASNTFLTAYYVSGTDDLPGHMLFEKRTLNDTEFFMVSSRITCWSPLIPTAGQTTNNTSENETLPNRIYFSKLQQPEAVPLYRYMDIGSADEPIKRVVALRDSIIVLKTDGVYRISGQTDSNFSPSLLDNTVRILAPNSVAVLANQVFFFSTQGVVAASDSGVAVMSRPIENVILTLSSDLYPNFAEQTFAVGYESDRKYILWTVTTDSDPQATQAFVYNTFTNSWTRWLKDATCGRIVSEVDKLFTGGPVVVGVGANVFRERKTFTTEDQADEQYDVTITGVSGLIIDLVSTSNIQVGYTLRQSGVFALVEAINSPTQIVVDRLASFVNGAAIVYKPISVVVTSTQISGDNPGMMKHFRETSFLFANADFTVATATFFSDFSVNAYSTPIRASRFGGWGTFPWGTVPWGGFVAGQQRVRTLVPMGAQRCNWLLIKLSLSQAFTSLSLQGWSVMFEWQSERQRQ